MSYAHPNAIEGISELQAALNKQAVMMRRVYAARIAGKLTEVTVGSVDAHNRLIQKMLDERRLSAKPRDLIE